MNRSTVYSLVILISLSAATLETKPVADASDAAGWGISTKKHLEKNSGNSGEVGEIQTGTVAPAEEAKPVENSGQPALDGGSSVQNGNGAAGSGETGDPGDSPPDATPNPPEEKGGLLPAKNTDTTRKEILWNDKNQKEACEGCLSSLREQFLKTRHYSIQGAPCDTRDHAAVFLQLVEKCRRECPDGFLEQNGYTERIVRNITYLEKLGTDRCDEPEKINTEIHPKPRRRGNSKFE